MLERARSRVRPDRRHVNGESRDVFRDSEDFTASGGNCGQSVRPWRRNNGVCADAMEKWWHCRAVAAQGQVSPPMCCALRRGSLRCCAA